MSCSVVADFIEGSFPQLQAAYAAVCLKEEEATEVEEEAAEVVEEEPTEEEKVAEEEQTIIQEEEEMVVAEPDIEVGNETNVRSIADEDEEDEDEEDEEDEDMVENVEDDLDSQEIDTISFRSKPVLVRQKKEPREKQKLELVWVGVIVGILLIITIAILCYIKPGEIATEQELAARRETPAETMPTTEGDRVETEQSMLKRSMNGKRADTPFYADDDKLKSMQAETPRQLLSQ